MQAYNPTSETLPIRAAQYVRASTEHQQYSIENQSLAIASYATGHNMQVIQTYADHGKSGLTLRNRKGLRQLLQDVEDGEVQFSIILVYDVSRWGRFQDVDESAYYEYRCKRAKMEIHYCAEPFANDGSISSALLKTLKRTMAGEYSRELSAKVFAGKCRLVERGFRQGGRAGFGLRRLLVDRDGQAKGVLRAGEQKNISTDRVILVPGPPEEVEVIREIYRRYIEERRSMPAIADALNKQGLLNDCGRPWTRDRISEILTNPKYAGANVTNRKSFKLKMKVVRNPREMWVRRDGAFEGLVSPEVFKTAQEVLADNNRRYTDQELLDFLKRVLSRSGNLTRKVINNESGICTSALYKLRFGGLLEAYRRIGYTPSQDYSHLSITRAMKAAHRERITALIADLEHMGATVSRDGRTGLITINNELRVRFLAVRSRQTGHSGCRWYFRFDCQIPFDITVAARMSPHNDAILDYFIVPRFEHVRSQIYSGSDTSLLNIYRFDDLSVLKAMVRRTEFKETHERPPY
jgi:DNA invertase Pin-like site-specific DNA recombinase